MRLDRIGCALREGEMHCPWDFLQHEVAKYSAAMDFSQLSMTLLY